MQVRRTSHPASRLRRHLRALALVPAFVVAAGLGCVIADDCGPYAYSYRGSCYCDDGYDYVGDYCSPIMTWRVTDVCDDGGDIAWKLFSVDRDWTWPSGTDVYWTPGFDYDALEAIDCEFGEVICFGAESESGLEYGVGLAGTAECDDCCYECDAYEVDFGFLTCQ